MVRMLFNKSQSSDQALSTTVTYLQRPAWARAVEIVGDGDFEWQFTEQPKVVSFYDQSAGTYTNFTKELTNADGTGTGSSLNSLTTSDILYFGFLNNISGLYINVANANGTASIIDMEYYKTDDTWTDITETDNTASGGASFAVDGSITWTALTDHKQVQVPVGSSTTGPIYPIAVRMKQSGGFDSATSITEVFGIQANTTYSEAEGGTSGDAFVPRVRFDSSVIGGIRLKAAAGAPNVTVTWYGRI